MKGLKAFTLTDVVDIALLEYLESDFHFPFSRADAYNTWSFISSPHHQVFTGIIQSIGTIQNYEAQGADARMSIHGGGLDFSDVALGDSIAVNGVCLTAVALTLDSFTVDVSAETLRCTSGFSLGAEVNLERRCA